METFMHLKKALSSGDSIMCRLCLSPDGDPEPVTQDALGQYLVQKIFDCTSVQIVPLAGIASVLCADCKTRVEDFYLFRYQCIKNNEALNEFAAQFRESPFHNSESEIVAYFNELVQQTDEMLPISLQKQDPETKDVNNISLDHTYNAQETNIAHEFDRSEGLDVPEVKLEHSDDLSFKTLENGDPLETEPERMNPRNEESLEDFKMNGNEESKQFPKSRGANPDRVLPQVDVPLLSKPMERAHTNKPPFVCKTCNKEFKTREYLNQHTKTHNKDEQHKCPYCFASFVAYQRLVIHLRYHTGERPFECQVCHKGFVSQQILSSHSKIHNKDQYHQCPQCPAKFAQAGKIPIHIRTHHTGERPFVCNICNKAFAALFLLKGHMDSHNENKRFLCHYCPAKFCHARTLECHIQRNHGSEEMPAKPVQCDICQKVLSSLSSLCRHKKSHKPKLEKDKRYQCRRCSAKFYDTAALKRHTRHHTGERPYVCKVCGKAFHTSTNLKTHGKTHNKDLQHQCSYCPARFAQSTQLEAHLETHTGETTSVQNFCGDSLAMSNERKKWFPS